MILLYYNYLSLTREEFMRKKSILFYQSTLNRTLALCDQEFIIEFLYRQANEFQGKQNWGCLRLNNC